MRVCTPHTFNPVQELVGEYLQGYRQIRVSGDSKKAEEIRAKAQSAYSEGAAIGLATVLNALRCERYKHLETISLNTSWDVRAAIINNIETWYDETVGQLKQVGELKRVITTEERDDAWTAFWNKVETMCEPLIVDEKLDTALEEARREAVLAGNEAPRPEDRDWLMEETTKAQEAANNLAKITSSIPYFGTSAD